jgi:plastocyanin
VERSATGDSATATGDDATAVGSRPEQDSSASEQGGTEIAVTVSDGEVETDSRQIMVQRGTEVTFEVTADSSDELHVHGYDLFADVAPGTPARLSVTADIPGAFEVELEQSGMRLVELQVR